VLAVWGDTRSAGPAEDTARAVNAALAMEAAVARLNAQWAGRPDRTPMQIGVGLHHGVAMVGNVGHAQRMEFTVLGDVVNVAARLESANRQLGTTLLVSETIRDLLAASHRCIPLGRFGLKGRREAVGLFTPLGARQEIAPDWVAANAAALADWNAGQFSAAASAYTTLARLPIPLVGFFREQAERARHFAAHPPTDWQGAYRFDSK
jgi:adenylate cyclase